MRKLILALCFIFLLVPLIHYKHNSEEPNEVYFSNVSYSNGFLSFSVVFKNRSAGVMNYSLAVDGLVVEKGVLRSYQKFSVKAENGSVVKFLVFGDKRFDGYGGLNKPYELILKVN